TSISTRTPGSLNPTRQQLDELDALLQRMLELPVNRLDEGNDAETETEDATYEPPPPPPPIEQPAGEAETEEGARQSPPPPPPPQRPPAAEPGTPPPPP